MANVIKTVKDNFIWILVLCVLIGFRILSIKFIHDGTVYDEEFVMLHAETLIKQGTDIFGNSWPLYFKDGAGLSTWTCVYPLMAFMFVFGTKLTLLRGFLQALTMIGCGCVAWGMKLWTRDIKFFWVTFYVSLTLPWGFVQANRVWDPTYVPFYFGFHFLFFSLLMNHEKMTEAKRYVFSIIGFVFLVLLATVYPPCRIPAVALWIYEMVWAIRAKRIKVRQIAVVVVLCGITALPLALNMLNPSFNSRSAELIVFQGGVFYQELEQFFKSFASLFNADMLFFTGDISERHSLPAFGMLGTISIIPVIQMIRNKWNPAKFYMLFTILMTYISVGLTNDYSPHTLRSCLAWLPWSALIADGWIGFLKDKSKKTRIIWYFVMALFFIAYFVTYCLFYGYKINLSVLNLK